MAESTAPCVMQMNEILRDQRAEIIRLKSQLDTSRRVYITGPGGEERHAYGKFADGIFNPNSDGVLWDVGLTMTEGFHEVKDLCDIEIRLGGVAFAIASEVALNGFQLGTALGNKFDGEDMSRSVKCLFSSGQRQDTWTPRTNGWPLRAAWLTFHLVGVSDEKWGKLLSIAREEEDVDIYGTIVQNFQWNEMKLTSISFVAESVFDMIENLDRGPVFTKGLESLSDRMNQIKSFEAYARKRDSDDDSSEMRRSNPILKEMLDIIERHPKREEEDCDSSDSSGPPKLDDIPPRDLEQKSGEESDEVGLDEMTSEEEEGSDEEADDISESSNDDDDSSISSSVEDAEDQEKVNGDSKEGTAAVMMSISNDDQDDSGSMGENSPAAARSGDAKEVGNTFESTEENPRKRQRTNDSSDTKEDSQSDQGDKKSDSSMDDENVNDMLAFMNATSMHPRLVEKPHRTRKFIGGWMRL